MKYRRAYHTLTVLPDGKVLASGGQRGTDGVDETKGVLALGTAQRNIAAALVVAGQNFTDPRVVVMVVVVAVVGLLVLMPLARWAAGRGGGPEAGGEVRSAA